MMLASQAMHGSQVKLPQSLDQAGRAVNPDPVATAD
jgi:hypothetical protein